MELFHLAKDALGRKKNPITFPCYVLNVAVASEEELACQLSQFFLFTYRSGFTPLPRSSLTSDKGWGCLARSCQMMLARAVSNNYPDVFRFEHFRDIDSPTEAPFSLHNMVRGISQQNQVFKDEYWSPSQGCEAIRYVVANAVNRGMFKVPFSVLVADGGTVNHRDVQFHLNELGSVMILIPVRVGIKRNINQQTFMAMEHMLQTPLSIGIVGGVPNRSYYIIGTCGHRVLYLDPHVATKPAFVQLSEQERFTETTQTLPAVTWERIDTSLLFGFFVKSAMDWKKLTEHVRQNSAMCCGMERLFCIDTGEAAKRQETTSFNEKRPEDTILTWDSDDD